MLVHGHPAPGLHQPGISNMTQLYNPAQPQAILSSHLQGRKTSHARSSESGSPLLRRALSPERRFSSGGCRQTERNALSWDEQRHVAGGKDRTGIERSISSGSERLEEKILAAASDKRAAKLNVGANAERVCSSDRKTTESGIGTSATQISSGRWVSSYGPVAINKGKGDELKTSNEAKFLKPLSVETCAVDSCNATGIECQDSMTVGDSGLVVVGGISDSRRVQRGVCQAVDIQKPSTARTSSVGLTAAEAKAPVVSSGVSSSARKNLQAFNSPAQEKHTAKVKEVKAPRLAPMPAEEVAVRKHETTKTSCRKEKPADHHRPV